MKRRSGVVLLLAVAVAACHTITEELPTGAVPGNTAGPTVVPTTGNGPTPTKTATPRPGQTAQPTPTKTKTPTPRARATKSPRPHSGCGPGGYPPSCEPVARVGLVVFYVICNGQVVPNSKFATEAKASCLVRLDTTPKDAKNVHTLAKGQPHWTFGGGYPVVNWNNNQYTPMFSGQGRPGTLTATVKVDGIQSNTLTFKFK
jgi:hypothetical protein